MDDKSVWTIHTDGAARGNPGPAAFAYIIERPGQSAIEENGSIGTATNNIAEYTALLRALEHAHKLGGRRLAIFSDSDLMVQQMNGAFKVKNPGIAEIYAQAKQLTREFDSVTLRHVPRAHNYRADALCNEALDNPMPWAPPAAEAPAKRRAAATPAVVPGPHAARLRERALECLRTAAKHWAKGDPNQPPPETVCEEIWELLRQEGMLN
jgi:ribonuclease HI